MWRKAIHVATYVVITSVVSFLLIEILMILLEPHLYLGAHLYDPDLGFRTRPYSGSSNRFGFSDWDYPLQKPPGAFRILFVGDSFSWAGGREGNYTALLETRFEDRFGAGRVEVINSGYPSTHTAEQLAMLKKFGLRYGPDLVALGFFAGNDFVDASPFRKRIVVNGVYLDIDRRRELTLFGYPIVAQSRFFNFLAQRKKVYDEFRKARAEAERRAARSEPEYRPMGGSPPGASDGAPEFSEATYLDIERGRLQFCQSKGLRAGRFDDHIEYILDSISEMRDIVQARGAQLVVGVYPDEFQVREDLLQRVLDEYRLQREDFEVLCMQRILVDFLEAEAILHVDMTDEYRRASDGGDLYLPRNTHWNRAGNELAAEIWLRTLLPLVESSLRAAPGS